MPCLPCLALPLAAVGGGSSLATHSYKVFVASLAITIAALSVYYYYTYHKKCATCRA
jgi:hypothetical protein